MRFFKVDHIDNRLKVDLIKKRFNCVPFAAVSGSFYVFDLTNDGVVILEENHDFFRMYFGVDELYTITEFLNSVQIQRDLVIGFSYASTEPEVVEFLKTNRFGFNSEFYRYKKSFSQVVNTSVIEPFRNVDAAGFLYYDLTSSFCKYSAHFPTLDVFADWVGDGRVYLAGEVWNRNYSLAVVHVIGSTFEFNFWLSFLENPITGGVFQRKLLSAVCAKGSMNGALWVNSKNYAVRKSHEFNGWENSGRKMIYYVRKTSDAF